MTKTERLKRFIISLFKSRTVFVYWREERQGMYVVRCTKCGWAARSTRPIYGGKHICRECGRRGRLIYV